MATCKTCGATIDVPEGWAVGPAVRRHYWQEHTDRMIARRADRAAEAALPPARPPARQSGPAPARQSGPAPAPDRAAPRRTTPASGSPSPATGEAPRGRRRADRAGGEPDNR
jgi:hypothetical protein